MKNWILQVELGGEWEQCLFTSREQALAAFVALAEDYKLELGRAVLFPTDARPHLPAAAAAEPTHTFLN
ncbi:MAG: hypothetical protein JO211_12525 [Acidobacteriaceae bacterium]|nr:hypothetical protein [Acidobacteriaceae bacterium]